MKRSKFSDEQIIEVAPFQSTIFGFASYVPARVTSRSASYAMGDR